MRASLLAGVLPVLLPLLTTGSPSLRGEFRAGAAVVDITPVDTPVILNCGMLQRKAELVTSRLHARAIVLDDGTERVGIVVVDSCILPRPLLDEAKDLAAARTGLKRNRILISATHTHTAPAAMSCLGSDADPGYVPFLRGKLVEALVAAEKNLEPARAGWAVKNAPEFTALRRWIRRPDRVAVDPLGNRTVRANMHAGRNWDDVTGESGPEDPALSMISIQSREGRPLALLANFSMHYFAGQKGISADYYGLFCEGLQSRLGRKEGSPFVAVMSHGCSGDIWRRDYSKPKGSQDPFASIEEYAAGLRKLVLEAYDSIEYRSDPDLKMAEARLEVKYRVPDAQRLAWAQRIVEQMGSRRPKNTTEVYAREQLILHKLQSTEAVVQALRIGNMAIATTSSEAYALTGLKIKLQSPLPQTMVIELANGGDGYIPPPEQHDLGGYNTWPARSGGMDRRTEPRTVETALQLLEEVTGKGRRTYAPVQGPGAVALANAKPRAYWRLHDFEGRRAWDAMGRYHGTYESGVVFFLEGPSSSRFHAGGDTNRAVHFAGGRMGARIPGLGKRYSISLWFWNGMPPTGREVTGWMFSRGRDGAWGAPGDHLGIGGTSGHTGKLVFSVGKKTLAGTTDVPRWTWMHVLLVRDGSQVRVALNGKTEIEGELEPTLRSDIDEVFLGGRNDGASNFEGRIDEAAMFTRALTVEEAAALYRAGASKDD